MYNGGLSGSPVTYAQRKQWLHDFYLQLIEYIVSNIQTDNQESLSFNESADIVDHLLRDVRNCKSATKQQTLHWALKRLGKHPNFVCNRQAAEIFGLNDLITQKQPEAIFNQSQHRECYEYEIGSRSDGIALVWIFPKSLIEFVRLSLPVFVVPYQSSFAPAKKINGKIQLLHKLAFHGHQYVRDGNWLNWSPNNICSDRPASQSKFEDSLITGYRYTDDQGNLIDGIENFGT